jgi:hypothetical protein
VSSTAWRLWRASSCDLSRIIENDKPPQADIVQRGARFCGKLADFQLDQDAFVGLQAEGLCRPDAAAPAPGGRRGISRASPLPTSLSGQLTHKVWLLIVPVLRQLTTNPDSGYSAEQAEASPSRLGENDAAPAVPPAQNRLQHLLSQL